MFKTLNFKYLHFKNLSPRKMKILLLSIVWTKNLKFIIKIGVYLQTQTTMFGMVYSCCVDGS